MGLTLFTLGFTHRDCLTFVKDQPMVIIVTWSLLQADVVKCTDLVQTPPDQDVTPSLDTTLPCISHSSTSSRTSSQSQRNCRPLNVFFRARIDPSL